MTDREAFEKIVKNNDEEADLFFDVNRGGYRDAQMRYAFHWFKIFKEEASHAEHIAKQELVGEAVYFLQTGALQYTEVEKIVYEMAKPEYRRLLHTSPQPANHTDNSAVIAEMQARLDKAKDIFTKIAHAQASQTAYFELQNLVKEALNELSS